MKKYIPVMLVIILGMTTMFVGHKVSALSCTPTTLQEQINSANVIFAGKVTTVQTATSNKAAHASFDVIEYWKGQVGKKISVGGIYAWTGYTNPPSYFIVGNTYLVFANSVPASSETKNIPDNLIADIDCGRTTLLESAAKIKTALGQGKIPTDQSSLTFTRNLTVGFSGEDVVALQIFLENQGNLVMPTGVSKGYFGSFTRNALAKYQVSVGITPAIGYFGPITRAKVNSLTKNKSTFTLIPASGITTQIKIDYSVCKAGTESVFFGLGHTVFKFAGIASGKCDFQYGTEIENPMWGGGMSNSCSVPTSLGVKTYEVGNIGVKLDDLQSFCLKI